MTKYELLNILYAERNRVEKQYTRPGWTLWAIIAAIASLLWLAWDYYDDSIIWAHSVVSFFICYNITMFLECIVISFQSNMSIPVWVRGETKSGLLIILNILVCAGLIVAQLRIIPDCLFEGLKCCLYNGLYWVSFSFIIIFISLSVFSGTISIHGYVKTNKNNKYGFILSLLFIPSIILFSIFLNQYKYDSNSFRFGALLMAILFLFTLIPIGQEKIFKQIDNLISKVLYEDGEVNEKKVLQELELYVIGVRYGQYLTKKNLSAYLTTILYLFRASSNLIRCLEEEQGSGVDDIIKEGQDLYKKTSKHSMIMLSKIKAVYGDDIDKSVSPIVAVGMIGTKTMEFWRRIISINDVKPDDLSNEITRAFQETVGLPEIQKLINSDIFDSL